MEIKLQLFGAFRPFGEELILSLPDGAVVSDIRASLASAIEANQGLIDSSRFATETEVLSDDATLEDGAVIAIIPPVAGG